MTRHVITVELTIDADGESDARAVVRMLLPIAHRMFGRLGTLKAWRVIS